MIAIGPMDRVLCITSDQQSDGARIIRGLVYTVRRIGPPVPRPAISWKCLACSETDTDGLFLLEPEAAGAFGWCRCHFRPTWGDDVATETTTKELEHA